VEAAEEANNFLYNKKSVGSKSVSSSILRAALNQETASDSVVAMATVKQETEGIIEFTGEIEGFNIKAENNDNTDDCPQLSNQNVFNNVVVSDVQFFEPSDEINLFNMVDNPTNNVEDMLCDSTSPDSQLLTTIILEPGTSMEAAETRDLYSMSVARNAVVTSEMSHFPSNCQVITIPKSVHTNKLAPAHTKNILGKGTLALKPNVGVKSYSSRVRPTPYQIVKAARPVNSISVVGGPGKRQVLKLSSGGNFVSTTSLLRK